MISLKKNIISNLIKNGKEIVKENNFYSTLNLFLKYYFVNKDEKDFYLHNFIKDVTKNEDEFKVFMIYKQYALDIYYSKLRHLFPNNLTIDDIVYSLISYVKKSYDEDRKVLSPYIISIEENVNEILEKFNFIKNNYIVKIDLVEKFKKLKESMSLLEQAEEHQKNANCCREKAMEILRDIQNPFENNLIEKEDITKYTEILFLKNK
jgi:hypothetical protein